MKNNGFTLVELAFGLVIIASIIAGIVAGKSLIESSNTSRVVSDMSSYTQAIHAFELEYGGKPGDLINAYDYFGGDCGTDASISWGDWDGCNGDGDGVIDYPEQAMVFSHLSRAKIIPGDYPGRIEEAEVPATPGVHYPSAPFENTIYIYRDITGYSGTMFSRGLVGLTIELGIPRDDVGGRFNTDEAESLTGSIMKRIDDKMDDGLPSTGDVMATNENCVTNYVSWSTAINRDEPYILDGYCKGAFYISR